MPITIIQAANAKELTDKVTDVLASGNQPIGSIFIIGNSTIGRVLCQAMGASDSTITAYNVVHADNLADLGSKLDTALGVQGTSLMGPILVVGDNVNYREFIQAAVIGDQAGGGGGGATLPALATASELTAGTVTDQRMFSPKLIHDEVARQIAAITP